MKKLLLSMALALLSCIAVSSNGSAATITNIVPGGIDPTPLAIVGGTVPAGPNTVRNAYQFSFSGTADGTFGALSLGLNGQTTSINACGATCSDVGAAIIGDSFNGSLGLLSLSFGSFTGLAGGTYFLVVTGIANTFIGAGGYLAGLSLNVTAPAVPVPPALLLFVTALGGLGVLRRFGRGSNAAA